MRQYSFSKAILMSFYSRKLYRDVAQNWGGSTVWYLLFVSVVCWAIAGLLSIPGFMIANKVFVNQFKSQIPVMEIHNGTLKTPENRPYIITDPESKKTLAIIDTSGQYNDPVEVLKDIPCLVTDKIFAYNTAAGRSDLPPNVRVQNIPLIEMVITPEKIETFIKWYPLLMFPFLMVFMFIYRLVQAVFYALLGKIFALILRVKLSYGKIIQLVMVALTPVQILGIVAFIKPMSHIFLIGFLIAMGYLIFALLANKKTDMNLM